MAYAAQGDTPVADSRGTRRGREWAAAIIKRDGQCMQCGSTENLEADHILPVSTHPELSLDPSNGQALCRKCNGEKSNKTAVRKNWYHSSWLTSIN